MPDISMCNGGKCPEKNDCYRYRAKPGSWQSWFGTPPWEGPGTCCGYFMKIWGAASPDRLRSIEECEAKP